MKDAAEAAGKAVEAGKAAEAGKEKAQEALKTPEKK